MSNKSSRSRPKSRRASAAKRHQGHPARSGPGKSPAQADQAGAGAQAPGNGNLILLAGFAASALLFWYYHLLVLNQMTDLSLGIPMPDQLIGGYDAGYIDMLRLAMDEDARGQLSYVHKTAGLLFPLFLALVTMLAVNLHVARGPLRWGLWSVPMAFAVVDLWENAAIEALLTGPLDPAAVALASFLTVTRWVLLLATVAVAAFVLVRSFVATFRRKWAGEGLSSPRV
ncbi:hypothetical protein ACX8Z9_05280 [Arthrobacter halodurans]|uniref:Uncharacterized protein n=1 Tax=Arthrobacter halodurans TaxID=516699 RepID=A0ABV4UR64_9MICC